MADAAPREQQESSVQCSACAGSGQVPLGKRFVTRDMALDAGEPSMEGMGIGIEYGPCDHCGGGGVVDDELCGCGYRQSLHMVDPGEGGVYCQLSALRARQQTLEQALHEALEKWEYAAQYKGGYLAKKHGDAEDIAALRALLSPRPSVTKEEA